MMTMTRGDLHREQEQESDLELDLLLQQVPSVTSDRKIQKKVVHRLNIQT